MQQEYRTFPKTAATGNNVNKNTSAAGCGQLILIDDRHEEDNDDDEEQLKSKMMVVGPGEDGDKLTDSIY